MNNWKVKLALMVLLSVSCAVYAFQGKYRVPYQLAKNYFVKNTYPEKDFHFVKITSQKQLDEIFGVAAFMGDAGKPTKINFTKQFVIALINNTASNISELRIHSIINEYGKIKIFYSLSETVAPQSYSARFCSLLVVEKSYNKNTLAYRVTPDGEPLAGGDVDEFGCKPSTGYTWSVLKKKCISIREENGHLLSGAIGNLAFVFGDNEDEVELLGFQYPNRPANYILKNIAGTKVWKNGTITLSFENGSYVLRDAKKELARSSN